jgi:uncharacterized damage-inducible protein DinB
MDRHFPPPQPGEYIPYTIDYISLVPEDGRVLRCLAEGLEHVEAFVAGLSREQLTTPHLAGEWTIQDVLQHVADSERIFSYRLLRFARGDTTDLPGYDQEPYAAAAGANERAISDLLAEYRAVRASTVALLGGLSDEALERRGTQNGVTVSVRAIAYIIAGHELYHLRSLRENYGELRFAGV